MYVGKLTEEVGVGRSTVSVFSSVTTGLLSLSIDATATVSCSASSIFLFRILSRFFNFFSFFFCFFRNLISSLPLFGDFGGELGVAPTSLFIVFVDIVIVVVGVGRMESLWYSTCLFMGSGTSCISDAMVLQCLPLSVLTTGARDILFKMSFSITYRLLKYEFRSIPTDPPYE